MLVGPNSESACVAFDPIPVSRSPIRAGSRLLSPILCIKIGFEFTPKPHSDQARIAHLGHIAGRVLLRLCRPAYLISTSWVRRGFGWDADSASQLFFVPFWQRSGPAEDLAVQDREPAVGGVGPTPARPSAIESSSAWSASPSSMICSASREREIRSAQVLAPPGPVLGRSRSTRRLPMRSRRRSRPALRPAEQAAAGVGLAAVVPGDGAVQLEPAIESRVAGAQVIAA